MASDDDSGEEQKPKQEHANWNVPIPSQLSGPSFWPAGLSFSVVLLVIGPAFEYTVGWLSLAAGALLFLRSLAGWLLELKEEMRGPT